MNLRDQQGSALILVLSMIIIFTILAGIILSAGLIQQRFVYKEVLRLQALYIAEAGVYHAMQKLRNNPFWETSNMRPEGFPCTVSLENVGGYYFIRSTVTVSNQQVTVRAKVVENPPPPFDVAIYLWDGASRLNVAGSTIINGDIEAGQWGVQQNTLGGIPFSGALRGVTRYQDEMHAPFFDDELLKRFIRRLDFILTFGETISRPDNKAGKSNIFLPGELPVYFVEGDLILSPADSILLSTPKIIAASGDLSLEGPLLYGNGMHFLAGNQLSVRGEVKGENGIFYSAKHLLIEKGAIAGGQFLARQGIHVDDDAYLLYPSFLYLGGATEELTGHIELAGTARVDGVLIQGYFPDAEKEVKGRIVIGKDAVVRGGIFNPYETELHGSVYGSVLTSRFYFYQSPTRYINWLLDAKIDVQLRPESFHVPLLFNPKPDLAVVSWDVDRQDVSKQE